MIIRIRSPAGTTRVEIDDNATIAALKTKIKESNPSFTEFILSKNPDNSNPLKSDTSTIKSLGISHGDMIYLKSTGKEETVVEAKPEKIEVVEDEIDRYLESQDGWIQREQDSLLCKHGTNVKCPYCMPVAPWSILDIDPWKSEGVKFIPFHAYIRKVQANAGCKHPEGQKCLNCKALDEPNYRVKPCTRHPPWPEGICTLCDPGSVFINSQTYRHIDHVEFENPQIVDTFIQAWRETGRQRCGYLYGRYVPDKSIPLGIRAVVAAIYEPAQKSTAEGVEPAKSADDEKADIMASKLGLTKIGFIWTDLVVDSKTRKIIKNRDVILRGDEIIRMAKMQNKHASPSRQTMSGKCGSKFFSVLITGNADGGAALQVNQVSDQCMSMVSAGLITSFKDPALLRSKKTSKRYIPDILYRKIDEYKNTIISKAAPTFPTEFFIIAIKDSAPKDPKSTFKTQRFPVEHRENLVQTPGLAKQQIDRTPLIDSLSDFHLLVYLAAQSGLDEDSLSKIGKYVTNKENEAAVKTIFQNLFKDIKPPTTSQPPATSQPSTTARPSPLPPIGSSPAPTKQASPALSAKGNDLVGQLTGMGYTKEQAETAVWATGASTIEQALDFLLSQ